MSGLGERLDLLRRETGGGQAEPAGSAEAGPRNAGLAVEQKIPGSLRERIARVTGARSVHRIRNKPAEHDLAQALSAEVLAPGLLRKTSRLPARYRHGVEELDAVGCSHSLGRISGLSMGSAGTPLFFDTETTGLTGGSGTVAFLIGTAQFRGGQLEVDQFLLTAFIGEAALYAAFADQLVGATAVVSFNGRSFDAPLIATRARLCGKDDPLAGHPHVDLLHPLRRGYARQWDDCRLVSAERHLFNLVRKEDIPGALVPQIWLDWVHRGECDRLGQVLHHNWLDLVSLAALAPRLAGCQDDPIGHGADPLPVLRNDRGRQPKEVLRYLEAHRQQLEPTGKLELARLARREGDWDLALEIWSELARGNQVEATEHLAKYYEHRAGDVVRAREFTERLLGLEPDRPAHGQRAARLDGKLARRRAALGA